MMKNELGQQSPILVLPGFEIWPDEHAKKLAQIRRGRPLLGLGDDPVDLGGPATVHSLRESVEDRMGETSLGPEIIADRSNVDVRGIGDLANGNIQTALGEQPLRGGQKVLTDLVIAPAEQVCFHKVKSCSTDAQVPGSVR